MIAVLLETYPFIMGGQTTWNNHCNDTRSWIIIYVRASTIQKVSFKGSEVPL